MTNEKEKPMTEKEKEETLERLKKKFEDPIGITEKELEEWKKTNKP